MNWRMQVGLSIPIIFGVMYLCAVFVSLEPNIFEWHAIWRFTFLLSGWTFVGFFAAMPNGMKGAGK